MRIVDVGTGTPIVLVPGIQGRWEWMKPAVDALATRARVITFSLADEPSCQGSFDEAEGLTCYVRQIEDAMALAGVTRAAVCGMSFGGLIAAAFAAQHPERVSSLVLASALPPTWQPDARVRFYLRAPWLLSPLFVLGSVRMYREIAAASVSRMHSLSTSGRHAVTVMRHMFHPGRMARRVRLLATFDVREALAAVQVPTLVVTGEPSLDRIVPVSVTREYLRIWPHASSITIERTGHIGLITRPEEFARIVASFADAHASDSDRRRRVV